MVYCSCLYVNTFDVNSFHIIFVSMFYNCPSMSLLCNIVYSYNLINFVYIFMLVILLFYLLNFKHFVIFSFSLFFIFLSFHFSKVMENFFPFLFAFSFSFF